MHDVNEHYLFSSVSQYCNIVGFALYLVCFTNTYGHK